MIKITWLGHASFCIECGKVIYLDPFEKILRSPADYIICSHDHYDHSDIETIENLRTDKTQVITTPYTALKLFRPVIKVKQNECHTFKDFRLRTLPAYNIEKPYHPYGFGMGVIIEIDGKSIYHTGDTDLIPEIETISGIDLIMIPVDGLHGMDYKSAAALVKKIRPKYAIPMHYGTIRDVGSYSDAKNFKKLVEKTTNTKAVIIEIGELFELK